MIPIANITVERIIEDSFMRTDRSLRCAAMFGIEIDDIRERALIAPTRVRLVAGSIVFITGPSGGGKSTMLRAVAGEARAAGVRVVDESSLDPSRDAPLVDCIDTDTLPEAMSILARAGLAEARVFLRRPCELSDGQRARFELARLMREATKCETPAVCLVDEFGSTLDRLTACALAMQVRRWIDRTGHIAVLASAHDDIIKSLEPDVMIVKSPAAEPEVLTSMSGSTGHRPVRSY